MSWQLALMLFVMAAGGLFFLYDSIEERKRNDREL